MEVTLSGDVIVCVSTGSHAVVAVRMFVPWVTLVAIWHQANMLKAAVWPVASGLGIKLAADRSCRGRLWLAVKAWGKSLCVG